MRCPTCNHDNRLGAKFCEECAAPLQRSCASCGAELRPTATFCDECRQQPFDISPTEKSPRTHTPKHLADKILQSKSALEGERKQVTVLFADAHSVPEFRLFDCRA